MRWKKYASHPEGRDFHRALQSFALAAILAVLPSVASAETPITPDQYTEYQAAPETERIRLLIHLAKSGQHDLAKALLRQFPLQGQHAGNRTLYIEGLIRRANRDFTGAAERFRAALADDPKLTLVRSDLAEVLYELEQDESALHHLRRLQADAPDAEAAAGIGSFIDRIDSRTPYRFNAYLAAAPTTNVNSGSIRKKIYLPGGFEMDINESSKRKSGLGAAAGFNASYSRRLGNELMVVIAGGVDGTLYDNSDYNSLSLSQSAELRALTEGGYASFGFIASQSLETDRVGYNYIAYGPRVSWRHSITHNNLFNLSATYELRDYANDSDRDGGAFLLNGALTHLFDSSFSATVSGGYTNTSVRDEAAAPGIAYEAYLAGLSFYKELPHGITLNTSLDLQYSEFKDDFLVFFEPREDLRTTASATITKRDINWFGFAPSVQYTYTWNDSKYAIYDFDTHALDLRLTKDF